MRNSPKSRILAGFTLIELLVVVLIIGILAAIAVPQYFKITEKGKAAEATTMIAALTGAQESYLLKNGNYFTGTVANTTFDVGVPLTTKYFGTSISITPGTGSPGWKVSLIRNAAVSGYGAYSVIYDKAASEPLTCSNGNPHTAECTDLLPASLQTSGGTPPPMNANSTSLQ